MRAKEYVIFSEAVEAGIDIGWNRAFKHIDLTDEQHELLDKLEQQIKGHIYQSVTGQVCEYFTFNEQQNEQA